jgi:hypothetical protein
MTFEFDTDEKIGIARISLRSPVYGATAVAAGLFEAERALHAWKQAYQPLDAFEYTVLFADGAALHGKFSTSKKRSLPTLWRIIQVAIGMATPAGLCVDHALVDRNGKLVCTTRLEQYSLERS